MEQKIWDNPRGYEWERARSQLRLRLRGRLMLRLATLTASLGFRIPHKWVIAVTNNNWQMSVDPGYWVNLRYIEPGKWSV